MAISKAKSRKCPLCIGLSAKRVKEINVSVAGLLDQIRDTGEIPKAQDRRIKAKADEWSVAPHSLRYHIKECLLDLEIQDQRFQELKDLTEAIQTAKQEYAVNPTMQLATALTSLLTQWRGLAEDIEGQTDPAVTVEFITQSVLAPINRQVLAAVAEELREVRTSVTSMVPRNQQSFVDAQIKSAMSRVSVALRESTDDGLKALCEYYKVELEAQSRKNALASADQQEGVVH
jgi:hypothetical protein